MKDSPEAFILSRQKYKQRSTISMVRISKQQERRQVSPRKHRYPSPKTGSLKDKLPLGYRPHVNALVNEKNTTIFIGKTK